MAALINREHELTAARESAVRDLLPALVAVAESADEVEDEFIEVLRSPKVVAERFDRLQLEAMERVDVMVRAPIVATTRGNQAEFTALRRGVLFRGLYDREGLDDPEIRPHLARWQEAGEEIRVFPRDLPLKLALFDARAAIMPLPTPGHANGVTSVLIRNEALGAGLQIMFDHLWDQALPFESWSRRRKKDAPRPSSSNAGASPAPDQSLRRRAPRAAESK
jgi:hypothetical protein